MVHNLFIHKSVFSIVLIGLVSCDSDDNNSWGRGHTLVSDTGDDLADDPLDQVRVAFIADQGLGDDAAAVLDLVKAQEAQFLVIAGDFDYYDRPNSWDKQTTASLGANYPVFAVVGNHDTAKFFGRNGYQSKIIERMQNAIDDGATCTGDPGRNSACTYKGVFLAMSGVGVLDTQDDSVIHLKQALENNDAIWSVCVWHKNMQDMQVGAKTDDTGWRVYQACQNEGAIVITGHEHSYERTRTLTDLGNESEGHGVTGEYDSMEVGPGSTYVSVVGLGGRSIRDYEADKHDDDTWWSTIYTTNLYLENGEVIDEWTTEYGALFIDFNFGGDPTKAHAYFMTVSGAIIDEYDIVRSGGDGDGDGDGDGLTELLITSFDDAYVDGKPAHQNTNFGNAVDLQIKGHPHYETFIKPLELDIPDNATIVEATLWLDSYEAGGQAEARLITEDWYENTVTYNKRPTSSDPFTNFATPLGWVEIDVTSAVQAWANGEPIYGIHLRSDEGNGSEYYSSEHGTQGPKLQIWYTN
jgi:predicted phosphodiesterase